MKRKVLHVSCGGLGHGGISTVIFSIVENLYQKFDFDCIVFKKKCDREEKFLKYGNLYRINCYNNGKRSYFEIFFRPFILFFGIYRICKKNKYDIIHTHNNYDEGICLMAAKYAGIKKRIAHSHNTSSPKERNLLIKVKNNINSFLINKYATEKIGCSAAACKDFFRKDDYRVIFNSIDLTKFKFNENIVKDNNLFIHVGRYTYQKNQEFVIKVFEQLTKKLKNARIRLVGFGSELKKLQKIAHDLNLENKIEFVPGDQVDVSKEYDKAKYMIFPSIFEGFGIVLIEAQAKGVKCFVSEEAIQKEVNAGLLKFISLKKTPKEWADIIIKDINNDDAVDNSGVEKNLSKFNIENISKQYEELYKEE